MESYEKLLEEAYSKVNVVKKDSGRFEVPLVKGQVQGKNTILKKLQIT